MSEKVGLGAAIHKESNATWSDSRLDGSHEDIAACARSGCAYCTMASVAVSRYRPGVPWTRVLADEAKARVTFVDCIQRLEFLSEPAQGRDTGQEIIYWDKGKHISAWVSVKRRVRVPGLGDTGGDASFNRAKAWLADCSTAHPKCPRRNKTRLPRRVLDLEPLEDLSSDVRLVETTDEVDEYLCLSHCWGSAMPLRTLERNIASMKVQVQFDTLPTTFQESVILCRKLGVRWLWIDSLCIIQDNDLDWKIEAGKMHDVYSNALLTIAVSKAADSSGGLFTTGQLPSPLPACQVLFDDELYNVFVRELCDIPHELRWEYFTESWSFNHGKFPLLRRGWVLQERLLSPRVLHFGPRELLFECQQEYKCECGRPDKYTGGDGRVEVDFQDTPKGLAKKLSQDRGTYVAGVWEDDLVESLAWTSKNAARGRDGLPALRDKRLPSWSWAASGSAVEFDVMIGRPRVEVREIHLALAGPDPYGEIECAHLGIEGFVVPAVIHGGSVNGMGGALDWDASWQEQLGASFEGDALRVSLLLLGDILSSDAMTTLESYLILINERNGGFGEKAYKRIGRWTAHGLSKAAPSAVWKGSMSRTSIKLL
ncbi:hypothetical protein MY4824_007197 [Beauveria thailandica]